MKSKGYINLQEWEIDRELFRKNPNDRVFLESMTRKLENSPLELQQLIREAAESEAMVVNPLPTFGIILQNIPRDVTLIYKSESDPWFFV